MENDSLLFNCELNQPQCTDVVYYSNNFINENNINDNRNLIDLCDSQVLSISSSNKKNQSETRLKEEIIDFNIFDFLQAEDPEMINLLESVEKSSSTNNFENKIPYLAQISLNSTNNILESVTNSVQNESDTEAIFKIDEILESKPVFSEQFKELCDLLTLNKHETTCEKKSLTPLTPPLSPPSDRPSRVSMRLIDKKKSSVNTTIDMVQPLNVYNKITRKRKRNYLKHIKSTDDEDEEHFKTTITNGENTYHTNDHIYFNEYEDEENQSSNDSNSTFKTIYLKVDDFSEKDFKVANRKRIKKHIKKESNKEAATRYRLKKMSEKDRLFETKQNLEKENDQMKKKIELLKTEIYYLKHILVQLLFNKGLLTVN
jgi:hypothetical protein